MCFDRIGLKKNLCLSVKSVRYIKRKQIFFCRFNSYYVTGLFLVNTELSIL